VRSFDGHDIHQAVDEAKRQGTPGRKRRNKGISDPRGRSMSRVLSKFFAWLLQERKIASNPTIGVYCPPPPKARERSLSPEEIHWFWRGCDAVGYPFGPLCKLLLLTGCRREEASAITHSEIKENGTLWSLTGARTKDRKPHAVPLSPLVRRIINGLPRIESEAGYLFTTNGRSSISGFSKYKRRLDAAMLAAARQERGKGVEIPPWRLHDLRRSAATGLAGLGVEPHIIKAALNHVSGFRAGVAGTYNVATYAKEKRGALERWSRHVQGLVSGTPSNILTMPRKGA
jgi:integrase